VVIEVPLSQGLVAVIDDDDAEAVLSVGKWSALRGANTFYGARMFGRSRFVLLHRFLTGYPLTDHADGDGLNNRRSNLRSATKSQNNANSVHRTGTTSPYRGVSWKRQIGRWVAQIGYQGGTRYLGTSTDPVVAARAYDVAALETWGEYARLNFPEGQS
jgi:HNH endonuclease